MIGDSRSEGLDEPSAVFEMRDEMITTWLT
jgi:hypothetical protein